MMRFRLGALEQRVLLLENKDSRDSETLRMHMIECERGQKDIRADLQDLRTMMDARHRENQLWVRWVASGVLAALSALAMLLVHGPINLH